MRGYWRALGRFLLASVAASAVGSGLATLITFTSLMEWIGANSSAADVFVLGSVETGLRSVAMAWSESFVRLLPCFVVIWGPIYLALLKARRSSLGHLLIAGAATGFLAGFILEIVSIAEAVGRLSRDGNHEPRELLLAWAWFPLHGAVVMSALGVAVAFVFWTIAGARQRRPAQGFAAAK